MGKEFLRVLELAVASGALVVPGTEALALAAPTAAAASPRHAPVVRSARLDRTGLTIEFSEALRPSASVDPTKFRLTFAYYSKKQPTAGSSYYQYYYYYSGNRTTLTAYSDVGINALQKKLEQPQANKIRIPASSALDLSSLCQDIAKAPPSQAHAGLYLHYAGNGGPNVESTHGVALESIAPYWLTSAETTVTSGALPGHPIPIAVNCH